MLTSRQNPVVKGVKKLHHSKNRHKENLYLLEGTNPVSVAVALKYPLKVVLATIPWQEKHPHLWSQLQSLAEKAETVSEEIMAWLATTVNPDGVVAAAPRFPDHHPPPSLQLGLVLERIQDPGNMGTIIRTSVAMGVDFLWLSRDCVDLDHPKVIRASAGEWFKIKWSVVDNLLELISQYRLQGYQIVATEPRGSISLWQMDFYPPTLVLVGNESQGLSPTLKAMATHKVKIPLLNQVESLNVAVATSLVLAEYQRQRQLQKTQDNTYGTPHHRLESSGGNP
ncbi:MAG: RNA methyltransferase [Geminocystis sp.]|nr:RNA methyltransferase [Geminocystis sp.]MDW8462061.1 RNA methyltransferase [Geminocystis sp.]